MAELSAAAPRRAMHTRQIQCTGFLREDGLWDVEARLSDVRTYDLNAQRGRGAAIRKAGDPIHLMSMRITVNNAFEIVAVEVASHQVPYADCAVIGPNYGQLVGLKIEAGFNATVKRLFRGALGCTHLTELMGPLATAAFQTIRPGSEYLREQRGEVLSADGGALIDSCWGLRRGGQPAIVRWGALAEVKKKE